MKDASGEIRLSLPVGGRLSDPRFDVTEAVWGAIRAVAVKAITLPASWIGRVRFTPDSRIREIEVDPVRFERGAPALTAEGQAQVTRLSAFLQKVPEIRMPLTAIVSTGDLEELRLQGPREAVDRLAREAKIEDTRIESEVKARLVAEKAANLTRLGVVSHEGTVHLSGMVASPAQKAQAEAIARRVPGVTRVVNALEVRAAPE
jgi:hypothetical protein